MHWFELKVWLPFVIVPPVLYCIPLKLIITNSSKVMPGCCKQANENPTKENYCSIKMYYLKVSNSDK